MGKDGIISQTMSRKISHMMFFLSILVVWIHMYDASFAGEGFYSIRVVEDLISQGFCRIAVPLFFMISGYLHFSRQEISAKILVKQIPKKIPSLVIPYIVWNTLYTIYFLVVRVMADAVPAVDNWFIWVLKAIFVHETHWAFWFVLQLIFLFVLSPGLFGLYKNIYVGVISCVGFFVMYLLIRKNTTWFLLPGLLFFSLGAMAALHGRHVVDVEHQREKTRKILPIISGVAFVLLMLWRVGLMDINQDISFLRNTISYRLFEFAAPLAFWFGSDIVPFGKIPVRKWEKNSFLIYSAHGMALSVFDVVISKLTPEWPMVRMVTYLIVPIVVVVLILLIGHLLKRVVPVMYNVLSGGR